MAARRELDELLENYVNFNAGEMQCNFELDKKIRLVKRPVPRYSYALMRAALNVFAQRHFADHLNSLAFDCDGFENDVCAYATQSWPRYVEQACQALPVAAIVPLEALAFEGCAPGGSNRIAAWHRVDFQEFELDVLIQVTNDKRRLGNFEGSCFLHSDEGGQDHSGDETTPGCHQLGSLHMKIITDEVLASLGIAPEAAIAAIKGQVRTSSRQPRLA